VTGAQLGRNGAAVGEKIARLGEPRQSWKWKAPGLISDFSMAASNGMVLLSTIRDGDSQEPSERNGRYLVVLDRDGNQKFKKPLSAQTRVQAIRSDGRLAYVSNYEHRLEAIESNGNVRWTTQASCRPVPLDLPRSLLCVEDDAAVPGVVFRVFDDHDGRLLHEFSGVPDRKSEALAYRKTLDGRFFVVGMTGGDIALFRAGRSEDGSGFVRKLWERRVEGEITDVALAGSDAARKLLPGEAPEVSVLYWEGSVQKVALFERTGLLHSSHTLTEAGPSQQIEISAAADRIWLQGNGPKGQFLTLLRRESSRGWVPAIRRHFPRAAEYSIPLIPVRKGAVAGVEENVAGRRKNHLVGLDLEGELLWRMPVHSSEGAYLYGQGIAPDGTLVAVATDDGLVSAYRFGQSGRESEQATRPGNQSP
jgi:outer membrane protein assembly factor BamB